MHFRLDFGSHVREMEGVPILAYKGYDSFLELRSQLIEHINADPSTNFSLDPDVIHSVSWVHHTKSGEGLRLLSFMILFEF